MWLKSRHNWATFTFISLTSYKAYTHNPMHSHNICLSEQGLPCPFYRWGPWGTRKLTDLPWLVHNEDGPGSQTLAYQLASFSFSTCGDPRVWAFFFSGKAEIRKELVVWVLIRLVLNFTFPLMGENMMKCLLIYKEILPSWNIFRELS